MRPPISLILSLFVGLLAEIDQSEAELEGALAPSSIYDDNHQKRVPQVIRSVNPSAITIKPTGADQQPPRLQQVLLANQQVVIVSHANEDAQQEGAGEAAPDLNKGSHIDLLPNGLDLQSAEAQMHPVVQVQLKQQDNKQPLKQEQLLNLLLNELPMLEFEPVSGHNNNQKQSSNTGSNNQLSLRPIQLSSVGAQQQANRLRSRSAILMSGQNLAKSQGRNTVASNGAPAAYQISPILMGSLDGSVNGFTRRPNAHHVPCFFNAITCF